MVKFVIDIELSLTLEELKQFQDLSTKLGKSLPDIVRDCANTKAQELLKE